MITQIDDKFESNNQANYDKEHFSNTDLSDLRIVGTRDILVQHNIFAFDIL